MEVSLLFIIVFIAEISVELGIGLLSGWVCHSPT